MIQHIPSCLRGRRFSSYGEVTGAVQNWLKTQPKKKKKKKKKNLKKKKKKKNIKR
jgi:hypothetical protein